MPALQNAKWEAFAQALAAGKTRRAAQKIAGYRQHGGNATALANQPKVSARIAELIERKHQHEAFSTERAIEKTGLTKARVAEELALLAFASTDDKAVSAGVKRQALMDIASLYGYVIKRTEVREVDEFEAMDAEALKERVTEIVQGRRGEPTRH